MFSYTKDVRSSFYWSMSVLIHLQLSLLSLYLKAMPIGEGTHFDFILWVSLFSSTFTTMAYNISPSIIR